MVIFQQCCSNTGQVDCTGEFSRKKPNIGVLQMPTLLQYTNSIYSLSILEKQAEEILNAYIIVHTIFV